jgi:SAM-dependent methyltransferase
MSVRLDGDREVLVEDCLQSHPGVCEAAAVRVDGNAIKAYVVANDAYFSDALGRRTRESIAMGKWQKAHDLIQRSKEAAIAPVGFNTIGWNSSYTRQAIPDEEIREWIELTVASILEFEPRRVYEIGCGTGLLLTRIAPRCERYVGSDFAPTVLARLEEQLRALPALTGRVEVMERGADNFAGIDDDSFDAVVLNSVVQYFPSLAYLTGVLQGAVRSVKPGGCVFVGDVRNFDLLPAFASSVEFFQSADETAVEELRNRVRWRVERERELLVSPAYFVDLPRRIPKISSVEVRPMRGRANNEMMRYRFQAILHVGHEAGARSSFEFRDWANHKWSIDDIRLMLERNANRIVGFQGIQNRRIEKDLATLALMNESSAKETRGDLRSELETREGEGIHPEDLIELGAQKPDRAVFLSWAASREDGSYDAVFLPEDTEAATFPAVEWPQPRPQEFVRFANSPGQENIRRELIAQLESHCREILPAELVPDRIELLDRIVRTE